MDTQSHEESAIADTTITLPEKCDPCQLYDHTNIASVYCLDCEEKLCEACLKRHAKRKATMNHKPVLIKDKVNEKIYICSPCKGEDKVIIAVKFCQDCEEFLCEGCTKFHKGRKATRLHSPVGVEHLKDMLTGSDEDVLLCQPCKAEQKDLPAWKYCNICEEYLCEDCTTRHLRRKATKSHTPVSVLTHQHQTEDKISLEHCKFCDICLNLDINEIATSYCQECMELLCDNCNKRHRSAKVTKSHILTSSEYVDYIIVNCDICENNAAMYCKICEEALCKSCTTKHERQKITKDHTVEPVKGHIIKQKHLCDQCKEGGDVRKADTYCKECKEFLCDLCNRHHKAQKITKHHELVSPESSASIPGQVCDICANDDTQMDAKVRCKECALKMCDECSHRHKRHKLTKNHTTTPINKVLKHENRKCQQCDEHAEAIMYCYKCQDYLCVICSRTHKLAKIFSNHDLKEINEAEDFQSDDEKLVTQIAEKVSAYGTNNERHAIQSDKKRPGKPLATDVLSDSVTLTWEPPTTFEQEDYYQVSYKDLDHEKNWKVLPDAYRSSTVVLRNLKSNTAFLFRVRVVYEDGEGPYSTDSDKILTSDSAASRIARFSIVKERGNPTPNIYVLPMTENKMARNEPAKIKKFEIGVPQHTDTKSKTIILFGCKGTGKSTLVDGIVNYVLGVNWDDPFRFTAIYIEQEEKHRDNVALSQTEWITCYTLNPERGSRLKYKLTIIDTPGFEDTRGLKRDQEIVEQIRQLFSEKQPRGVTYIDAVCFLVKAPDARPTAVQNYIFQSVMSLFGKDIEENICSLITFADGLDPPVLAALNHSGLPFGEVFTFNNSGLFAKNASINTFSPMFWEMGMKSFRAFFSRLEQIETKSLQLTKYVLDERSRLEATVANLQPQLDVGLLKLNTLKQEIKVIEENKSLIKDNANFEYEVEEIRQRKKELPRGQYVTNCINCHMTCHDNCDRANDNEIARCSAMNSNGYCKTCPDKCHWTKHANIPYIFEYITVKTKKTYSDMQKKYQEATMKLRLQEKIVEKLEEELRKLIDDIEDMMIIIKTCNERLDEIALRLNPLSMTEHIDLVIETEKLEKKDGFMQRINILHDLKKKAQITKEYEALRREAESVLGNVQRKNKRDTKFNISRFTGLFKLDT